MTLSTVQISTKNRSSSKQAPLWQWDERSQRYRHHSGRFIGARQMVEVRDEFIARVKARSDALNERLFNQAIDLQTWQAESRKLIRHTFIDQYVMARGGRGNMTSRDWGRLGAMVKRQYQFHDRFSQDIVDGKYSVNNLGSVKMRSRLYMEASSQAFERGKTDGRGVPTLPQVPGDGQTICRTNCKCELDVRETETEWLITWRLNPAEHCDDCLGLSEEWNPLRIAK